MSATSAPSETPTPSPSAGWGNKHAIELLRIGVGVVWTVNLVFILDPDNRYWSTFSQTALSFAPTTLGGPGLAQYVAGHPLFFSWGIALVTAYLALALLLGVTTRIACFVGSFFSALLLATQFGSTFLFPGGTDVGAHPLYILVYGVLVVGGAGSSISVDQWLRHALAERRTARATAERPVGRPIPSVWASSVSMRELVTYFVVGTLLSLALGFGLVLAIPAAPPASTVPSGPLTYVNMTINIDPVNRFPIYSPANFSVPEGRAVFTIVDNDSPVNWTGCPCPVSGTVGGVELINGTPFARVPGTNVAHTFNIPVLGLQILTPGQSVVQFSIDLTSKGVFFWYCFAPCGTGANPYNTPPMGTPGYMTGALTVN